MLACAPSNGFASATTWETGFLARTWATCTARWRASHQDSPDFLVVPRSSNAQGLRSTCRNRGHGAATHETRAQASRALAREEVQARQEVADEGTPPPGAGRARSPRLRALPRH